MRVPGVAARTTMQELFCLRERIPDTCVLDGYNSSTGKGYDLRRAVP